MLRHIDVLWSETCMEMMVVRQKKTATEIPVAVFTDYECCI